MVNKTENYWIWFIFSKGNNNTIQEVYFQMGVAIGIYAITLLNLNLLIISAANLKMVEDKQS